MPIETNRRELRDPKLHTTLDKTREASMVDEGGASAALMDIDDVEQRRRVQAALHLAAPFSGFAPIVRRPHAARRRRIGFALGFGAALALTAIAIQFWRARA